MRKNPVSPNGLRHQEQTPQAKTRGLFTSSIRLPLTCIAVGIGVLYCSERSIGALFDSNGSQASGYAALELATASLKSLWESATGTGQPVDNNGSWPSNDGSATKSQAALASSSKIAAQDGGVTSSASPKGSALTSSHSLAAPSNVINGSALTDRAATPHAAGSLDLVPPALDVDATAILWSSPGGSAWLTGSNWTGGAVPTAAQVAQFATNPTGAATVGINFAATTNAGTQTNGQRIEDVGAIEVTSARTTTLTINNSTGTSGASGTLRLTGVTVNGVDNVVLRHSGSALLTLTNGSTAAMDVSLNNATDNIVRIEGAGGITIGSILKEAVAGAKLTLNGTGAGIFTLTGAAANTYTGLTSVNAGELDLLKTSGLNAIVGNIVVGDGVGAAGSATLKLLNPNQIANTSDMTINSDGVFNVNGKAETIDALNSSSSTASITLGTNASPTALTVGGNNEATASYAGAISGSGVMGLTKTGTGTQTLSGNSTYTGVTTISQGVLVTGGTNALATGNYVDVLNGATLGIQVTNDGGNGTHNVYLAGQGVTGKAALYNLSGSNTFARQLNLDDTGGAVTIASASGSLTLSGRIQDFNGTPQLQFTGGTVVLTANNNTYAGGTLVNGGILLVNNVNGSFLSGTSTGPVSVTGSGSVLGGTGYVGGPVTLSSAGILRGGTGSSATGALTLTNTVDTSAGIIQLALGAGTSHSSLVSGGSGWTFGATQSFNFINLGATAGTTYSGIITGLSADPGTESSWTNQNGWTGTFSWDGTSGINFTLTAVPEPGTWAAGILTLLAIGWRQHTKISRNGCGATAGLSKWKVGSKNTRKLANKLSRSISEKLICLFPDLFGTCRYR